MMNNIFLNYIFNYRTKNPMFKNTSKNSYFLKSSIIFTILFLVTSIFNFVFAQQTYNLEIIFQRTAWDSYPNLYDYGISLAGGDVNGDSFSDIAVGASHWVDPLSWWAIDIYIFFGSSVMDTFYDAVLHCPPHFGHNESVLWIGDVNGDSIGDIVVGDYPAADGHGEVRIYFGGSSLDTVVDMIMHCEISAARFGGAVSGGDVNGDGYNDVIVGAREYDFNTLDGRVYVYYGGTLLDTTPDVIIKGHNGEAFGTNVGSGGDVNSDGFEDIVVGADENSEAYPGAGKVYVFCGGNPMDTIPDCWLHGEGPLDWLGWFGCDIMKVQDDYDKVITSTRFFEGNSYGRGKVYVLYGGDPMDTLPDVWMIGKSDSSALGNWCCSAGDINGDGDDDALAGAPNDIEFNGRGYVWLGGMPMDSIEDAYLEGDIFHHEIGWKVAGAGDVNGDGYDEMMFGNYAGVEPTVWVCKYTGPGITEHKAKSTGHRVEIYPNPFSGFMYIDPGTMQNIEHIELNIFDVSGREVMNYAMKDRIGGLKVNMEDLPDGIYFVQIKDGNDSIIKKAVKVH